MLQFYFLSIILNAASGLVLLFADPAEKDKALEKKIPAIAMDETFRLVLGILTVIVGFFKLLTVVRGDVPIVGDLFPALAGMAAGIMLLYEFYKTRSTMDDEQLPPLVTIFLGARRYVGILAVVSAATHFLFPMILFL